ncbi:MAG: hypothetical protein WBV71_16960 [Roseobacter sp.]
MKLHSINTTPTSVHVLNLAPSDVPQFVRHCVKDRSLSSLVKDLNNDLMFGNEDQRQEARKALSHIGFL